MSAPTLTLQQIMTFVPCEEAQARLFKGLPAHGPITMAQAHEAGADLEDLIWAAERAAKVSADAARRLRMWMLDCVARVLYIYEEKHPNILYPRKAIKALRDHADFDYYNSTLSDLEVVLSELQKSLYDKMRNETNKPFSYKNYANYYAISAIIYCFRMDTGMATEMCVTALQTNLTASREETEDKHLKLLLAWFSDKEPEPIPLSKENEE